MRTTRVRHGGSELTMMVVDGLTFLTLEEDGAAARIEVPVAVLRAMIDAADESARIGGDAGDAWGSVADGAAAPGGWCGPGGDGGWSGPGGDGVRRGRGGDGARRGRGGDGARRGRGGDGVRGPARDLVDPAGADGPAAPGLPGATIIPFPLSPPPPARSGLPWSGAHDAAVRTAWLAAAPDTDRTALLAAIARAVERGVGGVTTRLARLGCDPAHPGCALPDASSPPVG